MSCEVKLNEKQRPNFDIDELISRVNNEPSMLILGWALTPPSSLPTQPGVTFQQWNQLVRAICKSCEKHMSNERVVEINLKALAIIVIMSRRHTLLVALTDGIIPLLLNLWKVYFFPTCFLCSCFFLYNFVRCSQLNVGPRTHLMFSLYRK